MRSVILLICLGVVSFAFAGRTQAGEFAGVSIRMVGSGAYADLPIPIAGQAKVYAGVPLIQRYVEFPETGREFEIVITPHVVPICVVVIVDGHNVLTGERVTRFNEKSAAGRGFVLTRKEPYVIAGWRETAQCVRRFRVADSWKSLSWQLSGDPAEAGTIAVACFRAAGQRGAVGSLGTSAGTRVHSPVAVVDWRSEPLACELFALRYIGAREAAILRSRRAQAKVDAGFIGLLPGEEW